MSSNDEKFLEALRQDPPPTLEHDLRRKLAAIENQAAQPARSFWRGALAVAAAALVLTGLLASPAVRAAASDLLEVFRVKRFAAVPVNEERLARLHDGAIDMKSLLSDQVEVLEEPGEPVVVSDAASAAQAAGFALRVPTWIPEKASLKEISVIGRGSARLTVDSERILTLLDALGVQDATLPPGLDGAVVSVATAPAATFRYTRGSGEIVFTQALAPVVSLPAGVDLASLGELALRGAGMEPSEARLFARRVDWRGTLLVPVPAVGGHFRDVEVRGQRGLVVTHSKDGGKGPRHSILLWAEGDRVFAMAGRGDGVELMEMAESLS